MKNKLAFIEFTMENNKKILCKHSRKLLNNPPNGSISYRLVYKDILGIYEDVYDESTHYINAKVMEPNEVRVYFGSKSKEYMNIIKNNWREIAILKNGDIVEFDRKRNFITQ